MLHQFITASLLFLAFTGISQREIKPTQSFRIWGEVANEVIIDLTKLDSFNVVEIPDLVIKNNEGEIKKTASGLKGILLKDLLAQVKYRYEKPRELNEFYLVLIASDGYRVVYSWNELYNTEIGNQIYLVVEKDGISITEMEERMLIVSAADTNIGRRYIKGVEQIEVRRVK